MSATKKTKESTKKPHKEDSGDGGDEVEKLLGLFQQLVDQAVDRARKESSRDISDDEIKAADSLLSFRMIRTLIGRVDPRAEPDDPFPQILAQAKVSKNKLTITKPQKGDLPEGSIVEIMSTGASPTKLHLNPDGTVTLPEDFKGPVTSMIVRDPHGRVEAIAQPIHN